MTSRMMLNLALLSLLEGTPEHTHTHTHTTNNQHVPDIDYCTTSDHCCV
jgi:hypothetical protein